MKKKVIDEEKRKFDPVYFENKNIKCCFERMEIDDDSIYMLGWIFHIDYGNIHGKIVYNINEKEIVHSMEILGRPDVSRAFEGVDENVGFYYGANIQTSEVCEIYLEYGPKDGRERVYLGKIMPNRKLKSCIITKLPNDKWIINRYREDMLVPKSYSFSKGLFMKKIDVLVFFSDNPNNLNRFLKSIYNTRIMFRLYIVVNDSIKDDIYNELVKFCKKRINARIIKKKHNITINEFIEGVYCKKERYVAVLFPQCILGNQWLERLIYPLVYCNKIRKSIPFSCYCNYHIDEKMSNDIDEELKNIIPLYTNVTGINAPCYGLNTACLHENKKDVLVENLYIGFTNNITRTYVDMKRDSIFHIKEYSMLRILKEKIKQFYVIFDHNWGGGANSYSNCLIQKIIQKGYGVYRIIEDVEKYYRIEIYAVSGCCTFYFETFEEVYREITSVKINKIIINEIISFSNIFKILDYIKELKYRNNANMLMLVHDFYSVCPSMYLLDENNKHCYFANASKCQNCFNKNTNRWYYGCDSIDEWREYWQSFLEHCDEVRTFSENSKQYIVFCYPKLENVTVVPHIRESKLRTVNVKEDGKLTIGLLGNFMMIKGSQIIKEMLDIIHKKNLDIEIVVVGPDLDHCGFEDDKLTIHGLYEKEELPDIIENYKIDIIFISSICPETFSFTTEEAMEMGMPIACFNIGAPAERLRKYDESIIIDKIDSERALYSILDYYKDKLKNRRIGNVKN